MTVESSNLTNRRRQINESWKAAYRTAESVLSPPKTAVVGFDIGGSNIRWAVYPIENNALGNNAIVQGSIANRTEIKGIVG